MSIEHLGLIDKQVSNEKIHIMKLVKVTQLTNKTAPHSLTTGTAKYISSLKV